MEKPLKEMMDGLQGNANPAFQGPTREQYQGTIMSLQNMITALNAGQFRGHETPHIAELLHVLKNELAQATKNYEAASATHPEWGTSAPVATPPATA